MIKKKTRFQVLLTFLLSVFSVFLLSSSLCMAGVPDTDIGISFFDLSEIDISDFDFSNPDLSVYEDYIADISVGPLFVPLSSSSPSGTLALQMLGLSSGISEKTVRDLFSSSGFEVLVQKHYEKELLDPSHTCAYTIGTGSVFQGFARRNAILVSIRGTSGGEWFSNFDFCPSHSEEALFSENFLYCAQDVFLTLREYLDHYMKPYTSETEKDSSSLPLILICGHSRGAACANLLGMLVNAYAEPEKVYVYTFATPATIRSDTEISGCDNILNFINPCDLVPCLPMEEWHFSRLGTDIILPLKEEELKTTEEEIISDLYQTAPSITSYYEDRHSLTSSGQDEYGLTPFDLITIAIRSFLENGLNTDSESSESDFVLSEDSDFAPLMEVYREMTDQNYETGFRILMQHLPFSYLDLIMEYFEFN